MNIPTALQYAKSHEWVENMENGHIRVGISDFAQKKLGDLVFVNLPMVDDSVAVGEPFADVESVKAVSDIFSPVSGTVTAINEALLDSPALINEDPYEAWMIEVEPTETGELLNSETYQALCESEE